MQAEFIVLRILHIVGGVFWVGSVTLMAFFVFPSVRDAGPAGGQVMQGLAARKLMTWTPVIAVVTLLAGLRLLMKVGAFMPGYYSTSMGMAYSISGLIAILAFGHGMAVSRPLAMRMVALGGRMAAPDANKEALGAEMKTLQAKAGFNLKITATLLLITSLGMAVARYM